MKSQWINSGVELPGIWHTSIIVFGREYFYGSMGITSVNVVSWFVSNALNCFLIVLLKLKGETMLGEPDQIIQLGKTELPYSLFLEYISSLSDSTFRFVFKCFILLYNLYFVF